jgi:hypothetical protein
MRYRGNQFVNLHIWNVRQGSLLIRNRPRYEDPGSNQVFQGSASIRSGD